MIKTVIPTISQLREQFKQGDPSISIDQFKVEGNVSGNIVVGHGNVIGDHNVVFKVHSVFGALINLHDTAPSIAPRAPLAPPHPPQAFVGRERELQRLEGDIRSRQPALLHGHAGLGKTTLLRKIADSEAARSMPAGVIYLEPLYEGSRLSFQDVLQRLFDRLFESKPPVKLTGRINPADIVPNSPVNSGLGRLVARLFGAGTANVFDDSLIEAHLATARPLVLLDEMGLEQEALNRLPRLLPAGAIVATGQQAFFDDAYEGIRVTSLRRTEAIELFTDKSGLSEHPRLRPQIGEICSMLGDVPLAITILANAVRENRIPTDDPEDPSLVALMDGLQQHQKTQPPSQDRVQAAIELSFKLLFTHLDSWERQTFLNTVALPGQSVNREWLEADYPTAADTVRKVEGLELIYANSPRMRLPGGLRDAVRSVLAQQEGPYDPADFLRKAPDLDEQRAEVLPGLLSQLEQPDWPDTLVEDELGNILGLLDWAFRAQHWRDVIRLGRAVDPYLALHGLWDTWETVLKQVEVAARNVGDVAARAWALHQLGTREIGVGTRARAIQWLKHAFQLRLSSGQFEAAAYTLHNLRFLLPPGKNGKEDGHNDPDPTPREPRTFAQQVRTFLVEKPGMVTRFGDILLASLIGLGLVAAVLLLPSLQLRLEANPTKYLPVDQVIEYSYRVENNGFRQLPGPIFVTNEAGTRLICPDLDTIGNGDNFLDWNESMTCTSFYTIRQGDVQAGSVTNTATAQAGKGGILATASLTIRRDDRYIMLNVRASPPTFVKAGDEITVAFFVSNPGAEPVSGPISVTSKSLRASCPELQQVAVSGGSVTLPSGERLACTATYVVTAADVTSGSWSDTAWVSVGNFKSDPQTITVYGAAPPELTLTKSAKPEEYQDAGQEIQYIYEVTNPGKDRLQGVVSVWDDKVQVDCPEQDGWLEPGEQLMCSAAYTITETDAEIGSVTNTAFASTEAARSETTSLTIYGRPRRQTAVLALTKSAEPLTYQRYGQEIKYTYEVVNQGQEPLSERVTITDDKVTVTCPDVITIGSGTGLLAAGEKITCTGTYRIEQADMERGSVTNTASASAGELHSGPQSVTIVWEPQQLLLYKSAAPKTYSENGQRITYTYTVTNPGKTALEGFIRITDDRVKTGCAEIQQVSGLGPGESVTCTETYRITNADLQYPSITNTAWATVGDVRSDPQTETIYRVGAEPGPSILRLTTSLFPDTYHQAGEQITYKYFITNAGRGAVKEPVTVSGSPSPQVKCQRLGEVGNGNGYLEPGELVTCSGIYEITDADIQNGSVTSTATASIGGVVSDQSTVILYEKVLVLDIQADVETEIVNDRILYRYLVTGRSKLPLNGPLTIFVEGDQSQTECPALSTVGNGDEFLDWAETITCTRQYALTDNDITSASVTDRAVAQMAEINSHPVSLTTGVPRPNPALTLDDTPTPGTYDAAGQTITYTYTVKNSGDRALYPPILITDDRAGGGKPFECVLDIQRLAPGDSATCTGTYTIVDADLHFADSSVIANATASAIYRGQPVVSPGATATASCPYPGQPQWVSYVILSGEEQLSTVGRWYPGTSTLDLQKYNCMGALAQFPIGQSVYLPEPPPTASVHGMIRDTAGHPVRDTLVILINMQTGETQETHTNSLGEYSFAGLQPGRYEIFRQAFDLVRMEDGTQDFTIIPVAP